MNTNDTKQSDFALKHKTFTVVCAFHVHMWRAPLYTLKFTHKELKLTFNLINGSVLTIRFLFTVSPTLLLEEEGIHTTMEVNYTRHIPQL